MKKHLILLFTLTIATGNSCNDEKSWQQSLAKSLQKPIKTFNDVKSWWQNTRADYATYSSYRTKPHRVIAKVHPMLQGMDMLHMKLREYLWEVNRKKDTLEFEKVVAKYAPPEDIRKTIAKGFDPYKPPYLIEVEGSPSIYIKGWRLTRLYNAERAMRFVKERNLNLLVIPKKYIYKTEVGYRVFAEPIKPGQQGPLNLEEAKQLATFAKETGYADLWFWIQNRPNNWIRTDDGKIAIIDLEDLSFDQEFLNPTGMSIFDPRSDFAQNPMTPEARKWVEQEFEKTKQKTLSNAVKHYLQGKPKTLPHMRQYDPEDIDFERAKRGHGYYMN